MHSELAGDSRRERTGPEDAVERSTEIGIDVRACGIEERNPELARGLDGIR